MCYYHLDYKKIKLFQLLFIFIQNKKRTCQFYEIHDWKLKILFQYFLLSRNDFCRLWCTYPYTYNSSKKYIKIRNYEYNPTFNLKFQSIFFIFSSYLFASVIKIIIKLSSLKMKIISDSFFISLSFFEFHFRNNALAHFDTL